MENIEPTLGDLENQEPTEQLELEQKIRNVSAELGDVRLVLAASRKQEADLLIKRNSLRTRLNQLHGVQPVESFDGVLETIVPDGTMGDA